MYVPCYCFASEQTLLEASWTPDLWVTHWSSLRKFSLYSLGKNHDFCLSYKSYDHIVTSRRVSSSYRLHVHTFIMHVPGWKVGPPHKLCCTWLEKNDGGEERCQIEAHYHIKVENIKGEVARLRFAWTSVEYLNGKRMFAQSSVGTLLVHVQLKLPLLFSHEQQQQCLQSSTNDNSGSYPVALLNVHRLHII